MVEFPSQEAVADALSRHWDIGPEAVSPWKSPRIFRIEGCGIARIGFPRAGLTSVQLVELVDRLHAAGCPVPYIVPTSDGDLSIALGQNTLSVEQELLGDGCSSADLDVLFDIGCTLGKLYSVMYEFEHMPGQILPLGDWIDLTLRKAETWAAERHHDEYVRAFHSQISNDHRNSRVRFRLVHGDLRAPNVLRHGQSFLAELASRGEALELACGTGRIAIPLAEHGLEVTGIDYSEPMLSLARSKAEDRQVEANWIHDDIRRFDIGRQYGSILLLSNALWHLHDLADFEGCIRCVKHHLAPGGYFILDVFVPGLEILNRDSSRRYPFARYTDDKTGQEVQVTQSYRYEADTQIARMVHYRGDSDEIVGGLNLRMYFPQELDALLQYNGMRINEKFGNWDRGAFGPDSRHQLCFCTTTETG